MNKTNISQTRRAVVRLNEDRMPAGCFKTTLCDFCRRILPGGSIGFNFQAACPACYEKAEKLVFAAHRLEMFESTEPARPSSLTERRRSVDKPPPSASTETAAVCVKCRAELTGNSQKTSAHVCTICLSGRELVEIETDRAANEKTNAVRLEKTFGGQI